MKADAIFRNLCELFYYIGELVENEECTRDNKQPRVLSHKLVLIDNEWSGS